MNGNALRTGAVVLGVLVLVMVYAAAFTVGQTQQALVLRFGGVRTVLNQAGTDKPGLYFKVPFVESVVLFEKRLLDLDLPVQTVLSADRQNLEVDAFARYKIVDPLRFYQSVNNIQVANQRLSSFTNAAMRNVLASASRDAIVRTQREGLMNRIQEDVNRQAKNLGIEIVDLRLTRVDLPAANSQAVYQRMRTEREREAADLRANGNQVAATIKAKADRDVTVLLAEANQKADQLRGQGEADRNRILADAFGQDPDFFAFYRSMQAYEKGLSGSDTRLVISPGSEFFRYFNDPQGRARPAAAPAAGQ
ncbi:protease modulator HflC [Methylobacterium sp. SyP6R]|uniref:protease modulator HflC n=1 Tax=Methylobacterium sp. SyP6R TaxID=2718876 RepID=UPI001F3C5014|nr:protease modulator HflC [Methylobacterium sp. SyP6R]MCF4124775.1 protease modulator HflC [Methylobacterium sp. SyP6R]